MKTILKFVAILSVTVSIPFTAFAKADTTLHITNVQNIKVHQKEVSHGFIHENAKITFIVTGSVGIHLASAIEDDNNRTYVGGHKATYVQTIARECFVTIYKPQLPSKQNDTLMDTLWKETIAALTGYQSGQKIVVQFYQPDVDIRRSIITEISGRGHARLEKKTPTK